MQNNTYQLAEHRENYSVEELVERSADLENLIQLLIDYTHIPINLRNCSTESIRARKLREQIYDIVRVNREISQPNIIQQNLFDL